MNQDLIQQDTIQQDSMAAGGNGGFNTTTGYATGTICPASGTYRSSTRYMDTLVVMGQGETFLPGSDGKKTTWYRITSSLSTNKDGSFSSVKVEAGTI
jgi:hypothetical protein